jgi:hypothetical protein
VFNLMQIRDTLQKGNHKIIEFYDVRVAEAAVRALNRSDLAGKKINLETSSLSGTRRYVTLSVNGDFQFRSLLSLLLHNFLILQVGHPGLYACFVANFIFLFCVRKSLPEI